MSCVSCKCVVGTVLGPLPLEGGLPGVGGVATLVLTQPAYIGAQVPALGARCHRV